MDISTKTHSTMCLVGVPADKVGADAGEMLLNQLCHGGCVDDFLQDQVDGKTTNCSHFWTDMPEETI